MPVCHSQVLKTDHSSHIQWVLFSRRNALAHRFLLLSDMFLILWCMLLSSAYFVQNAGGYNVTIGIRFMFGKKGNFGPRLVSLILHLAACSSLLSLFSLFSLISLSLSFLSALASLSLCLSSLSFLSLSLSLSLVSCLFSCICLKLGFRSVPFGKCIWNIEITYWFVLFEAVSLHVNRTIERLKPLKK